MVREPYGVLPLFEREYSHHCAVVLPRRCPWGGMKLELMLIGYYEMLSWWSPITLLLFFIFDGGLFVLLFYGVPEGWGSVWDCVDIRRLLV